MATITLGGTNGIVWDGNTLSKSALAGKTDNITTASSNVTLNACSFDNKVAASPTFTDNDGQNGLIGNKVVSVNTQELVIDSNTEGGGLFGIGSVTVNSGVYLYSDNTSNAALKIAIDNVSVVNNGIIMGKGGRGGHAGGLASHDTGSVGGPAIEITSGTTGVTVTNNSGAYVAGGGGGGATGRSNGYSSKGGVSGGGGGAGGGTGGQGWLADTWGGSYYAVSGGSAGGVGASGGNGSETWGGCGKGYGGGAGGGGGGGRTTSSGNFSAGGGGGGRNITGTGGSGGGECSSWDYTGGAGGSAGNAGSNGSSSIGAGGGGGYGAKGGNGNGGTGASGGAAIKDNGQTYTLTNNGTVYGTT